MIVQCAAAPLWENGRLDTEGGIVRGNAGAQRILGYGEAEVLGQPGALIFTPFS